MYHYRTIKNIGPGITVSGGNTVFTVANAGNYYIAYTINLTAGLVVSSRITVNGSPLAGTINARQWLLVHLVQQ